MDTVKQEQHDAWHSVAPGWARWDERLRRLTQPVTDRLVQEVETGNRVLDIASGVGEPAISLAEHVGPSGAVVGTDLVEAMLAAARASAAARGVTNVEFRKVDGEHLDVPPASFDVATCRWGLMFMPDPVGCLAGAREALKPGGRLALACWAGPDRNRWISTPMGLLAQRLGVSPPPPGTPGLFALADFERLQGVIEQAGFTRVLLEELTLPMSDVDRGADYLRYMLDLAGPLATLYARVPEAERPAVFDEMAAACEEAGGGSARDLRGVTWVATATA
jgi:SAM-dependent methyltransferase